MSLTSQVPDAGTPIFDAGGYINPVWHQFFFNLLNRTGGTTGSSGGENTTRVAAVEQRLYSEEALDSGVQVRAIPLDPVEGPVNTHGIQYDPILHAVATQLAEGFMSIADKTKIDTLVAGAAVASVSGAAPISSTGGANPSISISAATSSAAGSLSAADKSKLDAIAVAATPSIELTADLTNANNTADSPILTWTLPANAANVATTLSLRLYGQVTSAALAGNISVWIKINGTKVMTQTFTLPNFGMTATGLFYSATATVRTIGASGTIMISSLMTSNNNNINNGPAVLSAGSALNTTIANTFQIGMNWSVANAGNSFVSKNAAILTEKP